MQRDSLKEFTRSSAEKAVCGIGPEPILRGIISALPPPTPDALHLGIAGFHFFVSDGFNKTMDWIDKHRAVARPSATQAAK